MRYSTNKADSGYEAYQSILAFGYQVSVYMGGLEVKDCMTADDELGYVLKASLPIRADGDKIVTEELYGDVEISLVSMMDN